MNSHQLLPPLLNDALHPPHACAGTGSLAGVMTQQGSGWMAYASSPYAPTHAQPPPRPTVTHTSVKNQTTVVQVVSSQVSQIITTRIITLCYAVIDITTSIKSPYSILGPFFMHS